MRHGTEHLAFHPSETEDGDVNDEDDQLAERRSVHHARCGAGHFFIHFLTCERCAGPAVVQAMQYRFHDDHGAIHDQAEIDRTKAHEISGDAGEIHHDQREQHAERDHRCHDQSGAQLSEEQHEHEDHDQCAFEEILFHRGDRAIHERSAIEEWIDDQAFGQVGGDLRETFLHSRHHLVRVLSFQHHHDAADHFAFAIACHGAVAWRVAQLHGGHVLHQYRRTMFRCFDHDVADILDPLREADAADVIGVAAALDVGPAGIGIVAFQRAEHIADAERHALQPDRIHGHFVLFQVATETVHLGDPGRAHQLAGDDPILHLAQLHRGVLVLVAGDRMHDILVHLAEAGAERCEVRLFHAGRQIAAHQLQPLVHQLPREIGIETILENDRHLTHPEARDAAQFDHVGQVADRLLDRVAHELLYLQRGQRGRDGDHLHLVVGDVRHGIHRQAHDGADAECDQHQRAEADDDLVLYREPDDPFDHGLWKMK